MINTLLNRDTKSTKINKLIDSAGKVTNTPIEIANCFNNYFVNVAASLKRENTPDSNPDFYRSYLHNPSFNSIYLRPVEQSEVFDTIKNFKNKSTGDTKMSALKIAAESPRFIEALTNLINKSFLEGFFPEKLKIAKVIALHKGGSKTDVANYRPISLLTSFSKVFEKLMHHRLLEFLQFNESLYDNQYGFRPGRSCEQALLDAQGHILDNLSKKKVSLLLLIDFSKAFDMVDHSILLSKLAHYGIRGIALDWLKSYLSNRTQFVSCNGAASTEQIISFGVPQGSILGPLLFVVYINDIPELDNLAHFILYADDANIIVIANTIDELLSKTNKLLDSLERWVDSNGLSINVKKTKYMIFSRTVSRLHLREPLKYKNKIIEPVTEARFLGVIVDDKLNWTKHIKTIVSKMSRYVGILYRLKSSLTLEIRKLIYHSLIQSHICFCSLVWGFAAKSNIDQIFTAQKKGIRAVIPGFVRYFYKNGNTPGHTKSSFNKFEILTVQNVIALNSLLFIEKVHHFPKMLPKSISSLISPDAPTNTSTFESSSKWLESFGTPIYRQSIFYKGPLLALREEYDELSTSIHKGYLKAYKNRVKGKLFETQFSGDEIEWDPENFAINHIPGLRKSERK